MERKISLSELQNALDKAYDDNKALNMGEVDASLADVDPDKFGIEIMLTDGTVIRKGDTDVASPLNKIAKLPIAQLLNTQFGIDKIFEKAGMACGKCACAKKPDVPVSPKGVRAISMVEPTGDPDGKWDILSDTMINLMGTSPVLNDKLFEARKAAALAANTVDTLAAAEYYLYDDAESSVDLYLKATSMMATVDQLAQMGATIAADGRNPISGEYVFDGTISQRLVAIMATRGMGKKMATPWMTMAGLPAMKSKGGAVVGVLPGVGAIAAYSPRLNQFGVPVKAALAIKQIMNELQLSVFSSACVQVVK